jgi:hypothetical protein
MKRYRKTCDAALKGRSAASEARLRGLMPLFGNTCSQKTVPSPLREKGRDEGESQQFVHVLKLHPHPQPLSLIPRYAGGRGETNSTLYRFLMPAHVRRKKGEKAVLYRSEVGGEVAEEGGLISEA